LDLKGVGVAFWYLSITPQNNSRAVVKNLGILVCRSILRLTITDLKLNIVTSQQWVYSRTLILNTADSRKKSEFFYKCYVLISSTVCVRNQTIVANIVFSKSYPRNLLVAFLLSDYHFYFQNCQFRALFWRLTAYQAEIQNVVTWNYSRVIELLISQKWHF
jgi:hypothetical protein